MVCPPSGIESLISALFSLPKENILTSSFFLLCGSLSLFLAIFSCFFNFDQILGRALYENFLLWNNTVLSPSMVNCSRDNPSTSKLSQVRGEFPQASPTGVAIGVPLL